MRVQPKSFFYQRPDGRRGLDGEPRLLYRLPELLESRNALVFFCEGEKDTDRLASLGLTATTCGAAKDWRPEFTAFFRFRDVVILRDNDAPGLALADEVAPSIFPVAARVKVCLLPGLPEHGDVSDWLDAGHTKEDLLEFLASTPEWTPPEALPNSDGAQLLRDVRSFIRRFAFLSESQATIQALWVLHTHTFSAADTTPYLSITSPEKESGKSRTLEILELVVASPWMTARVTAAVLVRKVDAECPTLLLDESDAAFRGEKEYAEALRGLLNSGYRRGGKASMCVGQGAQISYKDFSTFCPKAIAGIGHLPDTVEDRSIPIRLKRAAPGEVVGEFRRKQVEPEAKKLCERIERWSLSVLPKLKDARPETPDGLSDRQKDVAEPLLAIADAAGAEWPHSARAALLEVLARRQDDSIGVRLLADIRTILDGDQDTPSRDRMGSTELADALCKIETSLWGEWSNGKPISPARLARLLSPYGISPTTKRIAGSPNHRGYERGDFEDAWVRYLPRPDLQSATVPQPNTGAGSSDFSKCHADFGVAVQKREIANTDAACGGVALSKRPQEERGEILEGEL